MMKTRCLSIVSNRKFGTLLIAAVLSLLPGLLARGDVLLDDKWADGSRFESKRPAEAAVWIGRKGDVTMKKGALSTAMTASSQKLWTYFTEKDPVTLGVGDKLVVSISFIPRGKLAETTSRSFRVGVFHDATNPRVEADVNNDGGGDTRPWTDSKGYAVQMLLTGDEYTSTKPFDLGKRQNLESQNLLGTSSDYSKVSGGEPAALALDKEYTLVFEIARTSDSQVNLTTTLRHGKEDLSSWSVTDDGSYLGSEPIYDKFDQLFIRVGDNITSADRIDFTNLKVELIAAGAKP